VRHTREEGAKRISNIKIKKRGQKNMTVNIKIMINMIKNIKIEINMIRNIKKVTNIVQDKLTMKIIKNIRRQKKELKIMKNHVTNKEMKIIETDQNQRVGLDLILLQKMKTNKRQ